VSARDFPYDYWCGRLSVALELALDPGSDPSDHVQAAAVLEHYRQDHASYRLSRANQEALDVIGGAVADAWAKEAAAYERRGT